MKIHTKIQISSWYQRVIVLTLVAVRRRPPPSPAIVSSGEPRVGCALKSATHLWKSRGQNTSHAPPHTATNPRQFRRVRSTRRPPITRSSPDQFQQLRHLLLGTFQSLFFGIDNLLVPALAFPSPSPLGFHFLIKNGLCRSCILLLWNPHHHYCKTQLKELPILVCLSGVVVSWPRIS